jgi:hypothetical protein
MNRNPFAELEKEPITKEMIEQLERRLQGLWEDTHIVTHPNNINLHLQVGNLRALLWMAEAQVAVLDKISQGYKLLSPKEIDDIHSDGFRQGYHE